MQQSARKTIYICLALVSLAVFCIGLVELAVCRVADPILYRQITEPVKQLTVETSRNVKHLVITGRDNLVEMHQNFFEEVSLAAENLSRQVSQIAEAVEEAQLPPDDTELPPVPLAGDPNITSLIEQDGVYYLTGSSLQVVYFNQKDEPWASQLYGTDPIAGYACGPTALAMVVSTFRDEQVDPAQMSKFCADSGYWAKRQGSYLCIVPGVADAYSLTCTPVSLRDLSKENLKAHLANGEMAIALMSKGHFTSSGHFIVLRGVTLDGQILVADPASLERTLTPWDLDLILDELSPSRSSGAPLWLLSPKKEL